MNTGASPMIKKINLMHNTYSLSHSRGTKYEHVTLPE